MQQFLLILVKDFSTFRDFRNLNRTSESPKISNRLSQTPDEGIRTLSRHCCTKEVFFLWFSIQRQCRREPNTCDLSIMLHTSIYKSTDILRLSRAAWLLEHGADIGESERKELLWRSWQSACVCIRSEGLVKIFLQGMDDWLIIELMRKVFLNSPGYTRSVN